MYYYILKKLNTNNQRICDFHFSIRAQYSCLLVLIFITSTFLASCGKKSPLLISYNETNLGSSDNKSSESDSIQSELPKYTPTELFNCTSGKDPAPTRIKRLTKTEYLNTLTSLFGNYGKYLMIDMQPKLELLPDENSYLNFDNTELSVSTDLIDGFFEFAYQLAIKVDANTSYTEAIDAKCIRTTPIVDSCITSFIKNSGMKIFRRPLTDKEISKYFNFFKLFPDPREAFRSTLTALLQSPNFLYKLEDQGTPINNRTDLLELTSYELASRLSYMMWGTMPDPALFSAAQNNSLKTQEGLHTQVERMINDPKAKTHIKHFYNQWLGLYGDIPDAYSFNFLDGWRFKKVRSAASVEVAKFLDYIFWEKKGNVIDLLNDRTVFLDEAYTKLMYNMTDSPFGKTELPLIERSGILTRVAMLTTGEDQTHPFRRGSKVMTRFMCESPPRPNEEGLPDGALQEPPIDGTTSTRHRFEVKTENKQCMTCHSIINPLAFALETYDSLGRYRTVEKIYFEGKLIGQAPIDTNVAYVWGTQNETVNGAVDLSQKLSENPRSHQCAVQQWYRFSHGQYETPSDSCIMDTMYKTLINENGSFIEMFKSTAKHPHFALKKVGP